MGINFFHIPNKYHQRIEKTIKDFVNAQQLNFQSVIDVEFVSKKKIQDLNLKFRKVNRPTDVLSFPIWKDVEDLPKTGMISLGGIIICPEMTNIDSELENLIQHSLDHLIGKHH